MTNSFPTVYVLCGVYNHLECTRKILKCLNDQNYPHIKTIIIDDGSTDGTSQYLKQNDPKMTVIRGNGNLWWTGSMYLGVEKVLRMAKNGDYILTINNDCFFDKHYINQLVNMSNHLKRAIVGSLIISQDDQQTISDAGVFIDWNCGKFIHLGPKKVNQLPKDIYYQDQINVLSTRGTIFPIEVFKKIGNFDKKNFPHYLSDYEFTYRANRAGYKLVLSYQVKVFNDMKRTGIGKKISYQIGSKEVFSLLFSRRSGINIIDNYRFIMLCCPSQYRLKNLFFLCKKIIIFFLNYIKSFLRNK